MRGTPSSRPVRWTDRSDVRSFSSRSTMQNTASSLKHLNLLLLVIGFLSHVCLIPLPSPYPRPQSLALSPYSCSCSRDVHHDRDVHWTRHPSDQKQHLARTEYQDSRCTRDEERLSFWSFLRRVLRRITACDPPYLMTCYSGSLSSPSPSATSASLSCARCSILQLLPRTREMEDMGSGDSAGDLVTYSPSFRLSFPSSGI